MENYLNTAFNLGYLFEKTEDTKTKELLRPIVEICHNKPTVPFSNFFNSGRNEALFEKVQSRTDELKQIEASRGKDLELER